MIAIIRLFADIALFRRGPQDVPGSTFLLVATVLGYVAVHLLVSFVLPPINDLWLIHLLADTGFTLIWYGILLRVFRRPERFTQTTTAVFGYQAVLAPAWLAVIGLVVRAQNSELWLVPILLIALAMLGWILAANARVLRAALEQSLPICVGLIVLQVVLSQIFLRSFFTPASG